LSKREAFERTVRSLTIEDASGGITTRILDDGDSLVVGRGTDCDIVISDPTISLLHSRIRLIDGFLMVTTFTPNERLVVNGVPSSEATIPEGPEAILRIGDKSLKLRLSIAPELADEDSALFNPSSPSSRSAPNAPGWSGSQTTTSPSVHSYRLDSHPTQRIDSITRLGVFPGKAPIDAFFDPERRLFSLSWPSSSTAQQLTRLSFSLLHKLSRGAKDHDLLATFRGVGKNWDFSFRINAGAFRSIATIANVPFPSVSDDKVGDWLSMAVELPFGRIFASLTDEFSDAMCRISSPLENIDSVVRFRELLAWIPSDASERFLSWVDGLVTSIKRSLPR
jgi:FHA domain